jgi:hypothetical protein
MRTFDEFVEELNKFPKIDTYCVRDENDEPLMVDGHSIMAETIKSVGATKEDAETMLMERVNEFIKGKKVWIRLLPAVIEDFDHGVWNGRSRIAVL